MDIYKLSLGQINLQSDCNKKNVHKLTFEKVNFANISFIFWD